LGVGLVFCRRIRIASHRPCNKQVPSRFCGHASRAPEQPSFHDMNWYFAIIHSDAHFYFSSILGLCGVRKAQAQCMIRDATFGCEMT